MPASEPTLREYVELQLKKLEAEHDLKFDAVEAEFKSLATALQLQASQNKEHFTSLNNEAGRILKAAESSVSRDTWDAFKQADQDWKAEITRLMQGLLTKGEFQLYKEATDKTLALRTGQSQGVGLTLGVIVQIITSVAMAIAIITAIIAFRQ